MLFREKIAIFLALLVSLGCLIDVNTEIGNRLWESYFGISDRYAVHQGTQLGYINRRGRLVIKPQYAHGPKHFREGVQPVLSGSRWGFIDPNGRWVIAPKFIWAGEFVDDLAVVSEPVKTINRYGFIDRTGKYVIQPKFIRAFSFSESLAAVKINEKWGYIDPQEHMLIRPQFQEARSFSQGLAAVKLEGKWGFVDTYGNFVIPAQFVEVKNFSEGFAAVRKERKWGYIDTAGQLVVDFKYRTAGSFAEGYAAVDEGFKRGYLNRGGVVVIEDLAFQDIKDFSEGLAAVQVNSAWDSKSDGQWGYINTSGKFVIEPKFDAAWEFSGNLARVGRGKNNLKRGYVNSRGKLIWDPADWAKSIYFRKAALNVVIVLLFLYFLALMRFNSEKRKRISFLKHQGRDLKGVVVSAGLFSDPRLYFEHAGTKFSFQPIGRLTQEESLENLIEADLFSEENHNIVFYLNLEINKPEVAKHIPKALIETQDAEFDEFIKIPRVGDADTFVREFLTEPIKRKLLVLKLPDSILRVSVLNNRFIFLFKGPVKLRREYDWLFETAVLCYDRMKEILQRQEPDQPPAAKTSDS